MKCWNQSYISLHFSELYFIQHIKDKSKIIKQQLEKRGNKYEGEEEEKYYCPFLMLYTFFDFVLIRVYFIMSVIIIIYYYGLCLSIYVYKVFIKNSLALSSHHLFVWLFFFLFSAGVELMASMTVDAFHKRIGLRMRSTLHSSIPLKARSTFDSKNKFSFDFDTPKSKIDLIHFRYKKLTY